MVLPEPIRPLIIVFSKSNGVVSPSVGLTNRLRILATSYSSAFLILKGLSRNIFSIVTNYSSFFVLITPKLEAQIGTAPDFSPSSSDLNTTLVKCHKFSVILIDRVPGQELFYKINFFGSS